MTKTYVTFVRDFLGGLKPVTILLLSEPLFRRRACWPPCTLMLADVKEDLRNQRLGNYVILAAVSLCTPLPQYAELKFPISFAAVPRSCLGWYLRLAVGLERCIMGI